MGLAQPDLDLLRTRPLFGLLLNFCAGRMEAVTVEKVVSPDCVRWKDWKLKVKALKSGDDSAIKKLIPLGTGGGCAGVYHIEKPAGDGFGEKEEFSAKLAVNSDRTPGAVKSLYHEVKLTKSLNHENIRKVSSNVHGRHRGVATALFEYMKGHDLFYLTAQCLFPVTTPQGSLTGISAYPGAHFVLVRVLRALKYLHGLGIIYNDLKPENVMVGADSFLSICETTPVKLIDFGLAVHVGHPDALIARGTPDWMSPENFASEPKEAKTCASDVYVFGLVIYSVFTAQPLIEYKEFEHKVLEKTYSMHYNLLCARRVAILNELDNMLVYRGIKETIIACLNHKALFRPTVITLLEDTFFANAPPLRTRSQQRLLEKHSAPEATPARTTSPKVSRTRDSA